MEIVVLDDYQRAFAAMNSYPRLAGHRVTTLPDPIADPADLLPRLRDAEAIVTTMQRTPITAAMVQALPRLKLISQTGRNLSHIDLAACTARGIVVSAGGGGSPQPVAEIVWSLILSSLRHIPQEVRALKDGGWQTTLGDTVAGKTLGIYAFGRIGSIVARVGRAFDMTILCWGREGSTAAARAAGYEVASSREAFFSEVDVLSLHIPLAPSSIGIITAADLARMKPTALVVNSSRAPLIDRDVLLAALKAGRPGFAAVDVFEREPVLGANDPLLALPNVVATPHLGYVERGTYEAIYTTAVDQILAFAAGTPINVANPDVLNAAT